MLEVRTGGPGGPRPASTSIIQSGQETSNAEAVERPKGAKARSGGSAKLELNSVRRRWNLTLDFIY
jgi:hypothetical protein